MPYGALQGVQRGVGPGVRHGVRCHLRPTTHLFEEVCTLFVVEIHELSLDLDGRATRWVILGKVGGPRQARSRQGDSSRKL